MAGPGVFFFWTHFRLSLGTVYTLRMRNTGQSSTVLIKASAITCRDGEQCVKLLVLCR